MKFWTMNFKMNKYIYMANFWLHDVRLFGCRKFESFKILDFKAQASGIRPITTSY